MYALFLDNESAFVAVDAGFNEMLIGVFLENYTDGATWQLSSIFML